MNLGNFGIDLVTLTGSLETRLREVKAAGFSQVMLWAKDLADYPAGYDAALHRIKPCIRGTRITVYDILEYMAGGMSEAEILADFPSLQPEPLRAVLMFAAQRERRLAMGIPHEIAA